MAYYVVPTRINAPTNVLEGLVQGLVHIPRATLVIEVKDADAFAKVLDRLVAIGPEVPEGPGRPCRRKARPPRFAGSRGSSMATSVSVPPSLLPLPAGLRPTILLGKRTLILGTTPAAARAALALEGGDERPSWRRPPGPGAGPDSRRMTS